MRLLKLVANKLELVDFDDCSELPPYAALSYRWCDALDSTGYYKEAGSSYARPLARTIHEATKRAVEAGIFYLWTYSLCVKQDSCLEKEEAVNSLFGLFRDSSLCLVYLHDLQGGAPACTETLSQCKWWSRAWTLQELIAPQKVEFYDSTWQHIGGKDSLLEVVSSITGISRRVLRDPEALANISIGTRMSWASKRTAKTPEEMAYALIGIFNVSMQVRRGEGNRAFLRLQEEILHDCRDGSIFAWSADQDYRGLLARSPSEFEHFKSNPAWEEPCGFDGEIMFSSKGIKVRSRLLPLGPRLRLEIGRRHGSVLAIEIREVDGVFVRSGRYPVDGWFGGQEGQLFVLGDVSSSFISTKLAANRNDRDNRPNWLDSILDYEHEGEYAENTRSVRWHKPRMRRGAVRSSNHPLSQRKRRRYSTSDSSEDEDLTDGGSDEETDYESRLIPSNPIVSDDLLLNPAFVEARSALFKWSWEKFNDWRVTFHQRRASSEPAEEPRITLEDLPGDLSYVMISHREEYFRFVCPFYAFDSKRHEQCLRCDLRSIIDVKRHVIRHHRRPPYCPTCKLTFRLAAQRDDHIRAMSCEFRDAEVEGISEAQHAKLSEREDPIWTPEEQWLRVSRIICPKPKRMSRSPYLSRGTELEISKLFEFWAQNSRHMVNEVLNAAHDVKWVSDDRVPITLRRLVLHEMLDEMFAQASTK